MVLHKANERPKFQNSQFKPCTEIPGIFMRGLRKSLPSVTSRTSLVYWEEDIQSQENGILEGTDQVKCMTPRRPRNSSFLQQFLEK